MGQINEGRVQREGGQGDLLVDFSEALVVRGFALVDGGREGGQGALQRLLIVLTQILLLFEDR